MMLEAVKLQKTYRIGTVEIRALQDVSLEVNSGEFVAIMGPSGSGKSTLMHVLGFLDRPDSGTLRLLGRDVSRMTEEEAAWLRNRLVGFVFQQFNLMPRSSALENVALPLLYRHGDDDRAPEARAAELLNQVGLAERMRHRPNELSGGQQQRVAIARALANRPMIILADEPTGNLDSRAGAEIMKIFQGLHEQGMTIILVTHDEHVAAHAGRIVRMADGRVTDDRRVKASGPAASTGALPAEARAVSRKYSLKEFRENMQQAWRMIRSNKLRSLLSILGVLIGVACVITMLALGRGAKQSITQELSRLGSNLVSVRPGSVKVHGAAVEAGLATRLSLEDARAILETVPGVAKVAPQVTGAGQAVYGNRNWSTRVTGTTQDYALIRNQTPVMGRFFTETENDSRRRVALLGQTVARELFEGRDPVGETIKINRINFQVIGLLPSMGSNAFRDQDDLILVPLATAMRRLFGLNFADQMDVQFSGPEHIAAGMEAITSLIIRRHRLTPERYDSFNVRNYADIQQALSSTTQTFSVLLGAVAAISLVVGGIGIMNIMLVSVKERTREIGLRKAVGAQPSDIRGQFLVESMVITFLGGLAGMILGAIVSWLITLLAAWKTVIGLDSVLLAFVFSAGVGIVFGLWPAHQAAKLDPIQSLRYE